jgi:hypothetical protein
MYFVAESYSPPLLLSSVVCATELLSFLGVLGRVPGLIAGDTLLITARLQGTLDSIFMDIIYVNLML